jgi:hypothetical protein
MNGATTNIDDRGVRRELANGKVEAVAWDDLEEVCVLTTADGPFAEDVFFVLAGRGGGCVVPQGARRAASCWGGCNGCLASTTRRSSGP